MPFLHLEVWVSLRKDRARMRQVLRKVYGIARRVTEDEGGNGPRVFLVNQDPPRPKTPRLIRLFGLKTQEDLWVELTFYPNKVRMKKTIRKIWANPRFSVHTAKLDKLVSRRKIGFSGTLAYAILQQL